MIDNTTATNSPAKLVLERRVAAANRAIFEDLARDLVRSAGRGRALEGSSILATGADHYVILLRFASRASLDRWLASADAVHLLARVDAVAVGADHTIVRSGLETWFSLPGFPSRAAPPKWKMALVTWGALLPQVIALGFVVPRDLPFPLGVAISTAIPVALLTWVIMPRLTALLARWLYPDASTRRRSPVSRIHVT